MKSISRLLVMLAVVFGLLFGYGSALAEACLCTAHSAQQHACCQKVEPCHQHGIHQQKASSKTPCLCSVESKSEFFKSFSRTPLIPFSILFGIVTLLISTLPLAASRQKPLWLRHLFYPDESQLYLTKQSLLL